VSPLAAPAPRPSRSANASGLLVAAAGIAVATALVALLDAWAPVVSLGVLYVLPVLLVATRFGVALGVATAVASMLAYNWFLLPPTREFTIADSRHWGAVAVLLVVAVVSARIAEDGRREARSARAAHRETALIGDLARIVLAADRVERSLPDAAARLREQYGVAATITLDPYAPGGGERTTFALRDDDGTLGWLRFERELTPAGADGVRTRVVPALVALLAAGRERERLAAEAVQAETLRRSDEVKTTLLRSVGHDLRTPLTQIGTAAAALRSPSLQPDERVELARGIEAGTERLAAMIEKLLDLSRLEAGAARPQADRLPLDDLVRDALDGVAADPGRVTLEVEDPVPVVRADATQVVRILANLIENALIHGGDGPVLIRVAQRRGRAVVRVVDRGAGVPDDQREAIFAPFHRSDPGSGSGSGLGLAIARGFAEANGGALRVESYPGQGSAFVLELEPAAGEAQAEEPAGGTTAGEATR
jgi:two-component system sensor histidine kinase KdpD